MLSIGIVGLPNVGKSTLFNTLTKQAVPAENYPFCTIDPSVGVVAVPDERLISLSRSSESAKTIPAVMEFVDIAGLVKGAAEGQGLGNKFLSNIREADAIAEVVRIFPDSDITHVDGDIDPMRDIETINLELILADLETVTKRLSRIEKDAKRGDKAILEEQGVLLKLQKALESGKLARQISLNEKELTIARGFHLLSMKPILYILNAKNEDEAGEQKELMDFLKENNSSYVIVDVSKEEQTHILIQNSFKMLGLITFFTTGTDETRGWTIKKDSTAPQAGAAIHTDFQDKFIRAEVISYDDLLSNGSYATAREKGLVRTEGKNYVVKDGDVIEFKI